MRSLRFRWSLKFVLLVVAVICLYLAIAVNRGRDQLKAVQHVKNLGGRVAYSEFPGVQSTIARWISKEFVYDISSVDLACTKATDSDVQLVIRAFPQLVGLDLEGTRITDDVCCEIAKCSTLQDLSLRDTRLHGTQLDALQKCPKLWTLDLSETSVNGEALQHVATISSLRVLKLEYTTVTNNSLIPLKHLKHLYHLRLDGTQIDDGAFDVLDQMPQLKWVSTYATGVSTVRAPSRR